MAVSIPAGNHVHPLLKERHRLSTGLPPGLVRDPRHPRDPTRPGRMQARTAAGWSDRRRRHNVKEEGHGVVFHLYEWTHKHFPNFVNCRPIFIARASEEAGF